MHCAARRTETTGTDATTLHWITPPARRLLAWRRQKMVQEHKHPRFNVE
jgi:hypothetical protein